jgi:hypothetical protein
VEFAARSVADVHQLLSLMMRIKPHGGTVFACGLQAAHDSVQQVRSYF